MQAVLGVLPGAVPAPLRTFAGYVINANVPGGQQVGVLLRTAQRALIAWPGACRARRLLTYETRPLL